MKREWYRQGAALLHDIADTKLDDNEAALWHLGQTGFVLKASSTVYIDVMLNDYINPDGSSARVFRVPFSPNLAKTDYVICTHNHIDHLAEETVKAIAENDPKTRFVVPENALHVLRRLQIAEDRILAVNAGDTLELPDLKITAIATAHPVYQTDADGHSFSLAYMMEMNGIRILHLGDTYLTQRLIDELSALPSPDIFLPPINGQDFFRTNSDCIGNLNFIEAAQLSRILDADLTIPTHFDMFHGNTADPLDFIRVLTDIRPAARWQILTLGERFIYRK